MINIKLEINFLKFGFGFGIFQKLEFGFGSVKKARFGFGFGPNPGSNCRSSIVVLTLNVKKSSFMIKILFKQKKFKFSNDFPFLVLSLNFMRIPKKIQKIPTYTYSRV